MAKKQRRKARERALKIIRDALAGARVEFSVAQSEEWRAYSLNEIRAARAVKTRMWRFISWLNNQKRHAEAYKV